MISTEELNSLVLFLRSIETDTQDCEVKESVQQLPKNLPATISAFSNTDGGIIILGLSEKTGFLPAKGFDAKKIFTSALTAGDRVSPQCRPEVQILPFEGSQVVVMQIYPVPKIERPCYVISQGMYSGSYIRTGDGDRRLTGYEVDRLRESRHQPTYDLEPVMEASLEDLRKPMLEAIVQRNRDITPRVFGKMDFYEILVRLGAIVNIDDVYHPTLAGLLTAGIYPQQYFPRLMVTFTVYPGKTKAQDVGESMRYLDTATLQGTIPEILADAKFFLRKNMRIGGQIKDIMRRDVPDYPERAFREALINAMQHRDYSPAGRASQIQVNMFSDRLEILNPGGLYGTASLDSNTPGMSSTRNVNLSRLLESVPFENEDGRGYIIENRGTGILEIRNALLQAGKREPEIHDYVSSFSMAFYREDVSREEKESRKKDVKKYLLRELSSKNKLSVAQMVEMTGLTRPAIYKHIKTLLAEGIIETIKPPKHPKQEYRLKCG